jgi:hypothetical protein
VTRGIQEEARARNICIAISEKVPSGAGAREYDYVLERLREKKAAKLVVLFLNNDHAKGFLDAVTRAKRNLTLADDMPYVYLASDAW